MAGSHCLERLKPSKISSGSILTLTTSSACDLHENATYYKFLVKYQEIFEGYKILKKFREKKIGKILVPRFWMNFLWKHQLWVQFVIILSRSCKDFE